MKKFPSPPLKIGASLPEPQKLKLIPQEAIQSMVEVTSATSANDHNKPAVAIFNKSPRICVCTAVTGENIGLLPDLHSIAIILCNLPSISHDLEGVLGSKRRKIFLLPLPLPFSKAGEPAKLEPFCSFFGCMVLLQFASFLQ